MKQGGIRIETIRAKDLQKFFLEYVKQADRQQICPISQYRAESQSKNPYADENDAGLLVAYSGDQCVGYQGVMPGLLRVPTGLAKVYWCTAAYVVPEFRKRMVAIQLIKKLTSFKKDIVLTGFDSVVGEVFKGLRFQELTPLAYFTMRPDRLDIFSYPFRRFYRLQKKWPVLRQISESGTKMTRRLAYPRLRRAFYKSVADRAEKALNGIRWREVSRLESLPAVLPGSLVAGAPHFERGPEAIDWMLAHPWIREGVSLTRPSYYFSEAYESFRYVAIAIDRSDGQLRSTIVLSLLREKDESKLKVLDLNSAERDLDPLFWLVCKYAAQIEADEVEMPTKFDRFAASLPLGKVATSQQKRRYLCRPSAPDSPLAVALSELQLDLSDGDCAFT